MESALAVRERIFGWGREIGFSSMGIAPPEPPRGLPRLIQWLERGHHGSMDYLSRDPVARGNPARILEDCRSVICTALLYKTAKDPAAGMPDLGRISRYAWGDDYHRVLNEKLGILASRIRESWPGTRTRIAVDTSPVMEKAFAVEAGLGWMGKHTVVIDPDRGSWLFLGELLTTLPLRPTRSTEDRCGSCARCIEACPTGAIVEPYVLDARRCLSYWTIEQKGKIDPEIESGMGNWIYGCDICQEVCPWNEGAPPAGEPRFAPRSENLGRPLKDWKGISGEEFDQRFRGSSVSHAGYESFLRNVEAASRNVQEP